MIRLNGKTTNHQENVNLREIIDDLVNKEMAKALAEISANEEKLKNGGEGIIFSETATFLVERVNNTGVVVEAYKSDDDYGIWQLISNHRE